MLLTDSIKPLIFYKKSLIIYNKKCRALKKGEKIQNHQKANFYKNMEVKP